VQIWKTGVLALAATATLLTGCGGSDDDNDDGASVETDASADLSDDCQDALEAMAGAAGGMTNAFSGEVDSLEDAVEAMEDYADDAPEEIRDDFRLVADAYAEVVEIIVDSEVDLSGSEVPDEETMAALEEATSGLDSEELEAAAARIQEYFQEECGVDAEGETEG